MITGQAWYEAWLRAQPSLMAQLPELVGLPLGCHCAPLRCHGEILIKLIYELELDLDETLMD